MFGHRQAGQVAELSAQGPRARAATTEYQHPSHALMMPARTARNAQTVTPRRSAAPLAVMFSAFAGQVALSGESG